MNICPVCNADVRIDKGHRHPAEQAIQTLNWKMFQYGLPWSKGLR